MLQVAHVRKTRTGNLRRVVREVYLHNDVPCGVGSCRVCAASRDAAALTWDADEAPYLMILSSEVLLEQATFACEDAALANCVVPTTALAKVQQHNGFLAESIRRSVKKSASGGCGDDESSLRRVFVHENRFNSETLVERREGEGDDDFALRQEVRLAAWYASHCAAFCADGVERATRAAVLVNSQAAKSAAEAQGARAFTAAEFAAAVEARFPGAGDRLSHAVPARDRSPGDAAAADTGSGGEKPRYEAHWAPERLLAAVRAGEAFEGRIRMYRHAATTAVVATAAGSVTVRGWRAVNRAIDGDTVVVVVDGNAVSDGGMAARDGSDSGDESADDAGPEFPAARPVAEAPPPAPAPAPVRGAAASGRPSPGLSGRVVGITLRSGKAHIGTLLPLADGGPSGGAAVAGTSRVDRLFRSRDARIPDIVVRTGVGDALENRRILVVVDSWARENRYPSGHYVEVLPGAAGSPETETAAILRQYDVLYRDFSAAVRRCLPDPGYEIPAAEIARRLDLRKLLVCSIDPPGCRDIDDALSCAKLPNGNYAVGVHIADVTHFVLPGTPLDAEAAERATSVYLVERRVDMLPTVLTTDLCSLVPDQDRLAFSVLWEIDPDTADIRRTDFAKTVIRSSRKFTYAEAQALIDGPAADTPAPGPVVPGLRKAVCRLNRLAKLLRKKRLERGALELASLEVKFQLDSESQDPRDVAEYSLYDTNKLVEEFMLLANSAVAEFTLRRLPVHAVLRRHSSAKDEALLALKLQLERVGFSGFEFATGKQLADSLARATKRGDPVFNRVIRALTTQCMNEAVYVCAGEASEGQGTAAVPAAAGPAADTTFYHYGLATALYTHFTSPIRRYADVLVHRMLAVALGLHGLPESLADKAVVDAHCKVCNVKHRNAKWAAMASVEYFTYRYFLRVGPREADAVVIGIKKTGLHVQVARFGMEPLAEFGGDDGVGAESAATPGPGAAAAAGSAAAGSAGSAVTLRNHRDETETIRLFDHVIVRIEARAEDVARPKVRVRFLRRAAAHEFDSVQRAEAARKAMEAEIARDRQGAEGAVGGSARPSSGEDWTGAEDAEIVDVPDGDGVGDDGDEAGDDGDEVGVGGGSSGKI